MITANVSKILEELLAYKKDTDRRLENMATGFSYKISETAVSKTPLGDANAFMSLYLERRDELGLEPKEGFARGSWQVNTTGQFSIQALYGATSGDRALSLIKANKGDYKLGETLYVGNKGYYIKALENGRSDQSPMGIMQPTLDNILSSYQVDLVRLFKEG